MAIEFLSNESWLNPQINYLLFLQGLRVHLGSNIDVFFMSLTRFGEIMMPTLIISIIYWCFDSMAGLYLFSLNSFCYFVSQILKMTACVYRPWVLSDKVHPVEAAYRTAGGYSFPSGHSTGVSSTIGGMAYLVRKNKVLCSLLVLFVLMVGFSRNYLGVHTPQDVIVGLSTGLIFIFIVDWIIKWCEKDKNRYLYILVIFDILVAIVLYYICNKTYPADYVNGKLLVDPSYAIYNSFIYYGWISGLLNGVFLCRRWLPFDAKKGTASVRAIRGFIGLLIAYSLLHYIDTNLWGYSNNYAQTFEILFATGFFITCLYPLVFINVENLVTNRKVSQ